MKKQAPRKERKEEKTIGKEGEKCRDTFRNDAI